MYNGKDIIQSLRVIHGRIYEFFLTLKDKFECFKLVMIGKTRSRIEAWEKESSEDYNIDFVVTWVDNRDPKWQADKAKYSDLETAQEDDSDARFREWDVFKYWFRAVEQYAPWVHRVFLVTYGHVPAWLNLDYPKVRVVTHEEFISKNFLPTFSSHAIELSLQNIEELSEHFVYFNDDMYLTTPTEKSTFFKNGLPKYCGVATPLFPYAAMHAHGHSLINCIGLTNSSFDIRGCMRKNPDKWFSYKYGDRIKYNIRAFYDKKLLGMHFSHLATPYRKSTMKEVDEHFTAQFRQTQNNRIRSPENIMHQIFQLWEICNGSFEAIGPQYYGRHCNIGQDTIQVIRNQMLSSNNVMLCVNDNELIDSSDFELLRGELIELFETKYPQKSLFEK